LAEPRLRPACPADLPAILALNQANEAATSPLDAAALSRLMAAAFRCYVVDAARTAVLIALDQDADYPSPNFRWFHHRFARFVYIDRVIVADAARGQGWASRLYHALFATLPAAHQRCVACEVNVEPPNPASDTFHAALGFTERGSARLSAAKQVRYLTRSVAPASVAELPPSTGLSGPTAQQAELD
jgi:predicted GNAT superfamily acetyltransferase